MVDAIGTNSTLLKMNVKPCVQSININDNFHVPNLHANLLSMSKLISNGLKVHFNSLRFMVSASDGEMLDIILTVFKLY